VHPTPALELPDDNVQGDKGDRREHGDADDVGLIEAADDRQVDELASAKAAPGALDPRSQSLGP
jgi:hypothetical protein